MKVIEFPRGNRDPREVLEDALSNCKGVPRSIMIIVDDRHPMTIAYNATSEELAYAAAKLLKMSVEHW